MMWTAIIFIALFVGLSCIFWFTNLWRNERVEKYVTLLGAFATISVIISFLISLQNSSRQETQRRQDEADREAAAFVNETQKNWVELEQQFMSNYPYLTSLYKELYPESLITVPDLTPEQRIQAQNDQWHLSSQLLQTIENIVNTNQVSVSLPYGWYAVFQSWLKSPTLVNVWNKTRQYYNPTTATFIDAIISGQVKTRDQAQLLLSARSAAPHG
jgi:hypothetical protein